MALQPRIIACGNKVATFAMAVRFLTGPAVMAAASFAVGLRGTLLHVAIVQVLWVGKRGRGDGCTRSGEKSFAAARARPAARHPRCAASFPGPLSCSPLSFSLSLFLYAAAASTKALPFFSHRALLVCFLALQIDGTSRQLCPRALSPSSSQRSTTCTLTFSALRESPSPPPVSENTTPARTKPRTPRSVQRFSSPVAADTGALLLTIFSSALCLVLAESFLACSSPCRSRSSTTSCSGCERRPPLL